MKWMSGKPHAPTLSWKTKVKAVLPGLRGNEWNSRMQDEIVERYCGNTMILGNI